MKKEVHIDNSLLQYSVKKSKRAKRMRIAVYCDCSIVITSPQSVTETQIQKFIRLKSDWILKKIVFFSSLQIQPDIAIQSEQHYSQHKEKALKAITRRVRQLSEKYKLEPNEIRVKMLKTKWGSCSGKKNLNFNYKLIFLDQDLQGYVIIHELCHLKELNHTKKFWAHVESLMPQYTLMRNRMKSIGM